MSLESFIGFDKGEGMSESAFEAFKEKMKAAAAQVAAIKKEEKKQKKSEDELLKILFRFVKTSHKKELVLLISKALEENIPANFILAIILLGNPDVQKELGIALFQAQQPAPAAGALIFFEKEHSLPLRNRIEMDNWIKGLIYQADENPHKLLKYAYISDHDEEVKKPLIDLAAHIVEEYLHREDMMNFAGFILKGILKKTRETLEKRAMLD